MTLMVSVRENYIHVCLRGVGGECTENMQNSHYQLKTVVSLIVIVSKNALIIFVCTMPACKGCIKTHNNINSAYNVF